MSERQNNSQHEDMQILARCYVALGKRQRQVKWLLEYDT